MKSVADTLGVSRSNLVERLKGRSKPRGSYHKAEDAELLPIIRRLVNQRPTYGYRRIAALLNRERRAANKPVVNAKRVHRIMGNHAMLLEKHTAVRKGRLHDGKVMVMRSNLRWCSDGLEFACWNGEVVRLAFIIDAFDREIIAWPAVANAGISGSDVRDMMLEAVEKRFAATRAPHAIEHLGQWLCLHREGHEAVCPGAQSDTLLHAGRQSAVERHVRGIRQNPEARLYPHRSTTGRRNGAPAHRRLVWRWFCQAFIGVSFELVTGLHWLTGALGASTCIRRGSDLNHDPIHGGQAVLKSGVTLQHGGRYPDQLQSQQPLFFPVARRRLELL